jgi:hypothetical protein
MSLIEVLVATAVMAIAVVAALTVYDASRKAFAKGENATEQQESVRVAFDRLTSDLRMLGYNVDPDGNPARPDEKLEGALEHAIILRADFDSSDPVASLTPETALAGGAFATVSTGNDEIVAYVLAKPDGTGPDSITFQADVARTPRDGAVESVTIANVVLNPTSPPYTLYRVTLNNDTTTFGSAAFIVRTPVVENIRDLSFIYYGDAGPFKDPSATIPETPEEKRLRAGLTRVHVSLVGMTRQQDLAYDDPSDPAASKYRKFELKGDVTPRNAEFRGMQDLNADVTPPSKPATPVLSPGHCGGLIVSWAPNPPSDGVAQYRINWGPGSGIVSGSRNVPGSPSYLDGLATGTTYYVTIQAQDAPGNISARSDAASASVANLNTPSMPTGLTTSDDQTYHVAVSWSPVTTNTTSVPSADPQAPRIRDLAGYRLYWYPTLPFPNRQDKWNLVADETVLSPSSASPFLDAPQIACQDRFYRLTAVDVCGQESAATPVSHGMVADSGLKPSPPEGLQAQFIAPNTAHVRWRPISSDVDGQEIKIGAYQLYRSLPVDGGIPPAAADWGAGVFADVPTTDFVDASVPDLAAGQVIYYRVTGRDTCGNGSDGSVEATLNCTFTGNVEFLTPTAGQSVSGTIRTTVVVTDGAETYDQITITYKRIADGKLDPTFTSTTPGTSWTDPGWTPSATGRFLLTATVHTPEPCTQSASIVVNVTAPPVQP